MSAVMVSITNCDSFWNGVLKYAESAVCGGFWGAESVAASSRLQPSAPGMSMQQAANDQAQNVNLPADSMAFRLSMPRQPVRQAGSAVLSAGYFADSLPA